MRCVLDRDTHSNPVRVQDENGKTTQFCIYCNCTPSDNPMQSEICGHIGGKGNKFCRKCHVGVTQEEKTTADGYHALFEVIFKTLDFGIPILTHSTAWGTTHERAHSHRAEKTG